MVDAIGDSDIYSSPLRHIIVKLQANLQSVATIPTIPTVPNLNLDSVKAFTENASRINSPGVETVYHALDALECSTRVSEVLGRSNPLGLELTRHLVATFGSFDRFLFKPIEGAGSSVCVAIGVLFIITVTLQRRKQDLEGPFLIENGVEPVLQALFGLLSITYRNIGILKTLQDYAGRELLHYPGASSPDIIESLNGLLIVPSGQEQGSQRPLRLDPNQFYVRSKPQEFFVEGRVFIKLHIEDAGALPTANGAESGFSSVAYEEMAYSQLRRPITTYSGRGLAKRGIDLGSHTIIHTTTHAPALLEGEPPTSKRPIRVVAKTPDVKIDPRSRLNYGKTYTVEWNTK
ncbi:MAG: hypothetical protein Q9180_003199, partial [Flavoplaca navasiana]